MVTTLNISSMNVLVLLCLAGAVGALPYTKEKRLGNPDEWGDYYQGDIRLPLPKMGKNGLISTAYRWSNGQVPYTYAATFQDSKKPTVELAMEDYSNMTSGCITFVPRTSQTDYVEFLGDDFDGCYSSVGRQGSKQYISYPQWCIDDYGSVLHEMLHTLGFYHEQSTWNRDDYVTIMWDNVYPGYEINFVKYSDTAVTDFGEPYDYLSILHFSQFAFTATNQPTIVTLDPMYQNLIGQRVRLSKHDLNKLLKMYSCPTAPPE